MKKTQWISWMISFVMAITVFGIPVGAFAEEGDENADVDAVTETGIEAIAEETGTEPEAIVEAQEEMEAASYEEDKAKYEPFLNFEDKDYSQGVYCTADYDNQDVYGVFPELEYYNKTVKDKKLKITASDMKKAKITIEVGKQKFTTTARTYEDEPDEYHFCVDFAKVATGTPVTVAIKMGSYTKTLKLAVLKELDEDLFIVTHKNFTYDGKAHKTSVTVKLKKDGKTTTLKEGVDFVLDSDSLKNIGFTEFSVENTATGVLGKYSFFYSDTFRVNPIGTSIKSLKKANKAITVKWKKQSKKMSKKRITGYQIQLATNESFTKDKKTIKVKGYKKTSKKIKGLKKQTKYFVRVRTYYYYNNIDDEADCCSPWSDVKSVTTK